MKKNIIILFLSSITFTAISQGKLESSIKEHFDGTSWINYNGSNYEYDNDGNLITIEGYEWNNSTWEPQFIKNYTYNSDNKVIEVSRKSWDGIYQFYEQEKVTNTYNNNGLIVKRLVKKWDGIQLTEEEKEVYSYNNNNKISSAEIYVMDAGQWLQTTEGTIGYTGNNRTQLTLNFWNGTQWDTLIKTYFDYNLNNKIIASYDEKPNGSIWIESNRVNYDLDASVNRLKSTSFDFGIENSKTEYNYDLNEEMSDFSHPFHDETGLDYLYSEFPYFNKILSALNYQYNNQTNSFENSSKVTYNYTSFLPLKLDNSEIQNIRLHPNPSNDFIQISGISKPEDVSIYTVLGVKVFDAVINENEKLNIQELSKGLYLLKLENGKALKFLKK